MSIAIATTILHPTPSLTTWLDYHLQRVELILLYMDDPTTRPKFEALRGSRPVILLDGAQEAPLMSASSRCILRQDSNMKHAIAYLLGKTIITWLLHIDVDELLWENGHTGWASQPQLGCVTFTNHEAVAPPQDTNQPFHDCVWFKFNHGLAPDPKGVTPQLPFMAYGNGKSAVKLRSGVAPDGPHSFQGFAGEHLTLPGQQFPVLLHYPYTSYDMWAAKFKHYGRFSDFWFDDPSKPNYIHFMLQSRDIVQQAVKSGDWTEAQAFYESMTLDERECQRAAESGHMSRYAPFDRGEGHEES